MSKILLTKEFEFAAAHYIPNHPKCGNMHGHNYKLEAVLKGIVNPETGMLADFGDIKSIMRENILCHLEHAALNERFEIPTCENIAVWIYNEAKKYIPQLYQVRLWETEKNSVIYPAL